MYFYHDLGKVELHRKERNILQMLNKSTIFCKLGFQNVLFSGSNLLTNFDVLNPEGLRFIFMFQH